MKQCDICFQSVEAHVSGCPEFIDGPLPDCRCPACQGTGIESHTAGYAVCDTCWYMSAFEENLPIPFWFRLTFRLKYYLLGHRVKPLY